MKKSYRKYKPHCCIIRLNKHKSCILMNIIKPNIMGNRKELQKLLTILLKVYV